MLANRQAFYPAEKIVEVVKAKLIKVNEYKQKIDYLSFVPDGEPTLDINLGREVDMLKPLGRKIAVITNGSLLWDKEVRKNLSMVDLVSVKVDAVEEKTWRKMNHPHRHLKFQEVLNGMLQFAEEFSGKLITETMLIKDINDNVDQISKTAEFIKHINPNTAYISIPTRPPAIPSFVPAHEKKINQSYQIFSELMKNVEYLIGYEGNAFAFTGNAEEDILSILAVHPMHEEAIKLFIAKSKSDDKIIEKLIATKQISKVKYEDQVFYTRKFKKCISLYKDPNP
jgi:wyosine [tRNA(Phe)-imidazoG37] synthetase (radical SAM superfamily)